MKKPKPYTPEERRELQARHVKALGQSSARLRGRTEDALYYKMSDAIADFKGGK